MRGVLPLTPLTSYSNPLPLKWATPVAWEVEDKAAPTTASCTAGSWSAAPVVATACGEAWLPCVAAMLLGGAGGSACSVMPGEGVVPCSTTNSSPSVMFRKASSDGRLDCWVRPDRLAPPSGGCGGGYVWVFSCAGTKDLGTGCERVVAHAVRSGWLSMLSMAGAGAGHSSMRSSMRLT